MTVAMGMHDGAKTDFLIKLGGERELKKALNELAKEHELLRLKIEELVGLSIEMKYGEDLTEYWPTMSVLRKMPGQHKVMFDTDCPDSPYGMHGRAEGTVLSEKCVWCHIRFDD